MAESNERKIVIDIPLIPGTDFIIGQGFNSPFSHRKFPTIDLTHSVDFVVPVGTPITAVQDGVVKSIAKFRNCYRGFDERVGRNAWSTNIDVRHPQFEQAKDKGDILSMMQHLDPDSIQVKEGEEVTRGQVLAYTGLTGWVGPIPHLHLSMMDTGHQYLTTVPFQFRDYQGSLADGQIAYELFLSAQFGTEMDKAIFAAREDAHSFMATLR